MLLMLGDDTCTVVKFLLMALRWPLTVASARGGYFRNCALVMDGNVVKYPASMAVASVCNGGENINAW